MNVTKEMLLDLADKFEINAKSLTSHNEATDAVYYTLMYISSEIKDLFKENK